MRRLELVLAFAVAAAGSAVESASAQEEGQPAVSVGATRVEEAPEIDGRLDEPGWALAEVASGLRQRAWELPEAIRAQLASDLPDGYALDGGKVIARR